MTPVGSGVDTVFVAAAWDADVLMRLVLYGFSVFLLFGGMEEVL